VSDVRYIPQLALPEIGFEGMKRIRAARVLVIGAGGLGCPVLQYLTGMGVGHIGIVDHDTVSLSNLHRQILYTEKDVSASKALTAATRLKQMNSQVEFSIFQLQATLENLEQIADRYDIIVDCTDNYEARYAISNYGLQSKKPVVFGAVQQFEGIISVFDHITGVGYMDLFAQQTIEYSQSCEQAGIMGHVAGHVGTLMVNEVVKLILDLDNALKGKILSINLLTNTSRIFNLVQRQRSKIGNRHDTPFR
jgi:sulfur-carrier protein adenylyltransferase/sulfurtransferase